MDTPQAIVLGLVRGITELLPVSPVGHASVGVLLRFAAGGLVPGPASSWTVA